MSRALLLCMVFLWPTLVWAHTEDSATGFMSGLMHPIFGIDHFLAMLSVGVVSAQMGGSRVYWVPAVFMMAMTVGATVGIYGYEWMFAEAGIAASVIVLGVFIAIASSKLPLLTVAPVTAFFGSLHGNAHGLEMPYSADPVYYAGGFLMSTATIHLLGVGIGHLLVNRDSLRKMQPFLGYGITAVGFVILVSLFV
jgi:urease accessory protein